MNRKSLALMLGISLFGINPASAAVYDAATDFEAGWLSNSNPNGVWSYGYSTTLGGSLILYTDHVQGGDSPNQQMLIDPSVNCCVASPSLGFNNGGAFFNGNVGQAASQLLLVASVDQNLVTSLVFNTPRKWRIFAQQYVFSEIKSVLAWASMFLRTTLQFLAELLITTGKHYRLLLRFHWLPVTP